MEETGISPQTKRNLELLGQQDWLKQFYLAGGTACALYFGHRISFDLDFFTTEKFNSKEIVENLQKLGDLKIDTLADDTFLGIFNKVKISFFQYKYPSIGQFTDYKNIKIASLQDLVAMKIDALQSRVTKRDFIDLYTLLIRNNWNLGEAIEFFKDKFESVRYNIQHVTMSLIYFDDADKSPEVIKMNDGHDWTKIKEYFVEQVKKLANK